MGKILQHLKILTENECITIGKLERIIGASKGVLSRAINNDTDIQAKWVEIIAENYPQYSLDWLILGEGPILKSSQPISTAEKRPKDVDNGLVKPLLDRIESQAKEIARLEIELDRYRTSSTVGEPPLNGQD